MLIVAAPLTVGTQERPVAGRDALIILSDSHGHWAGEDVQGELLNPFVPVAFIELGAVLRVSEETRSLTHLRPQGLIEGSEASWAKLLPGARVPVVVVRARGWS